MAHAAHKRVILDMESSESPVYGQQERVAYNGRFESICYHPLFLFNHSEIAKVQYLDGATFIVLTAEERSWSRLWSAIRGEE